MSSVSLTADLLLALALRQAQQSAERYEELADSFEVTNNFETASAFTQLAESGRAHTAGLPRPNAVPATLPQWADHYPEISDTDSVHYLMPPYYAFDLAQRHEGQTRDLIQASASGSEDPKVLELLRLQEERFQAVLALRNALPKPPPGWWEDDDEPNFNSEF